MISSASIETIKFYIPVYAFIVKNTILTNPQLNNKEWKSTNLSIHT